MPVKTFKPTSSGQRGRVALVRPVTKEEPERRLTKPLNKQAGRNVYGRITVRHRGGGAKRALRLVDFKRDKHGIPAKVAAIEYDPNRTACLALLHYADGEKRYILHVEGLKVGDVVTSGSGAEVRLGNALPLSAIPTGTPVHNVELEPGKGAQLARSAGAAAQVIAKEADHVLVRLPSGEMRRFNTRCSATIGQIGNIDWRNVKWGKAGRKRHKGIRPAVRGSAMTPRDHPHGGGEGRSPIGMPGPKTPWGKPALGYKTRERKPSDRMIAKRRKS
ncbi:MAG: 50S ribosomal protein L2 [Chloroflexi bacterium]|nr:50S ribosomal protein L2 [Chloroflexota bacterium]